jgi:hypothetical protein
MLAGKLQASVILLAGQVGHHGLFLEEGDEG